MKNKKLVALDIGSSSVKLAEIDWTARGPMLRKFAIAPLSHGSIQAGEILELGSVSSVISDLTKSARTKRKMAITGMWGNAVIVKKISMPKMDPKLVSEQIKWEAEQYIPFDINEVSLDHHILNLGSSGESMDVLLVAAKQDFLFRFLECIEAASLKCSMIDVAGFALANCFEVNYGRSEGAVALLNIGAGVTNFVIVDRGEVIFNRDLSVGGHVFTTEISKALGVSLGEAEALKVSASLGQEVPDEVNGIIASASDQILEEVKTTFEFYTATAGGVAPNRFYVSGGSIFIPRLVEQISASVNIPFEPFDPFQKVLYDSKAFTADYIDQIKALCPIVLGLALRKLDDR